MFRLRVGSKLSEMSSEIQIRQWDAVSNKILVVFDNSNYLFTPGSRFVEISCELTKLTNSGLFLFPKATISVA